MTDLAEFLAGEFDTPEDDETRERFVIDGDRTATWALRKLAAARAEADRIKMLAQAEVDRVKEWERQALAGPGRDINFFEGLLGEYLRMLQAEGRAKKSYKLPAGTITSRKAPDVLEVTDEELFRDFAEGWNRLDLLHIKITPNKKALKEAIDEGVALIGFLCGVTPERAIPGARIVEGDVSYGATPSID